ncbi:MAG TPA: hypothetical protein VJR05_11725 [Acidimicrobiia bacterium]|nr:hypothetical protein [Acidimicrobiia bacterium]
MKCLPVVSLALLISCGAAQPALSFGESVPEDVRQLTTQAFADFLEAFPGQADCVGTVMLTTEPYLGGDRGRYDPEGPLVALLTPGTAARLRHTFIHELAHHLEFACPGQVELRGPFLSAQGFSDHRDWFEGDSWQQTPSEHFAEAVVEVVEGRRGVRYGITLSEEALQLVQTWGQG